MIVSQMHHCDFPTDSLKGFQDHSILVPKYSIIFTIESYIYVLAQFHQILVCFLMRTTSDDNVPSAKCYG